MLTVYHAPNSRSSTVVQLLHEMGIADRVDIRNVSIRRMGGAGAADPANPHPEGKVPYLVDGDVQVRERGAIILYLTDAFPGSDMGRPVGHPQRGAYLSWLFYYQGIVEPVVSIQFAGVDHPFFHDNFRDYPTMLARIDKALSDRPWLLGDAPSAVDLLIAGPFAKFATMLPVMPPAMSAWVERYRELPSTRWIDAEDAAA